MSRFYDLGSSAWHDLPVDPKEHRKKVTSLRRALMYGRTSTKTVTNQKIATRRYATS